MSGDFFEKQRYLPSPELSGRRVIGDVDMSRSHESSRGRIAAVLLVILLVASFCFVILGAAGRLPNGFVVGAAGTYATPAMLASTMAAAIVVHKLRMA